MTDLFTRLYDLLGPIRAMELCTEHGRALLNDDEWRRLDLNNNFDLLSLRATAVSRSAYFYALDRGLVPLQEAGNRDLASTPFQQPNQYADSSPSGNPSSGRNSGRRFAGLLDAILHTQEGNRNNTIHWAACRAAEMVAAKEITRQQAECALIEAARRVGVPFNEAVATIRSGFRTVAL